MLASHYAEPLERHLTCDAAFHRSADPASEQLAILVAGSLLRMLDNSRGWAWGYGPDGRVGYVRAEAVAA